MSINVPREKCIFYTSKIRWGNGWKNVYIQLFRKMHAIKCRYGILTISIDTFWVTYRKEFDIKLEQIFPYEFTHNNSMKNWKIGCYNIKRCSSKSTRLSVTRFWHNHNIYPYIYIYDEGSFWIHHFSINRDKAFHG